MTDHTSAPRPTLRRLPVYYRRLREALDKGITYVSSEELGDCADVPAAQVRKDLHYVSEFGRPGVGYDARALAGNLEEFLGLVNDKEAFLAGAGNLGRALALYPGFQQYGLQIIALFDCDPAKLGDLPDGRRVWPIEKLPDLARRLNVQMGIIAATASCAQEIADAMVAGGIRAIWNFAPVKLTVPDGVLVKNEDLAAELATLSHHIAQQKTRLIGDAICRDLV
jgi:redox-sensing transcriptional repressor